MRRCPCGPRGRRGRTGRRGVRAVRSAARPMLPGSASMRSWPSGASSCAQRCSSRAGSPPMPMLPSASRTVAQRPCPGSGSNTERCRAGAPAWRTRATAAGEMSTPSAGIPRSVSATVSRPGPQPTSRTGPRQWPSNSSSAASGGPYHRDIWSGSARPSAAATAAPCAARAAASSYRAIAPGVMLAPR